MARSNDSRRGWAALSAAALLMATAAGADTLTITAKPNPAQAGAEVTFTITPKVMVDADVVNFTFGDGGTGTIAYSGTCAIFGGCGTIKHTYAGPATLTVVATGTIGGHTVNGSISITITATSNDRQVYVPTGAHNSGYNNTHWRTDLWVNNPGTTFATYTVALLVRDNDNSTPTKQIFSLNPGVSAAFSDVLQTMFGFTGAAALQVTPGDGKILVTSRTYNQADHGSFGQFVPAIPVGQSVPYGTDARLIGLGHDPSLASGFRTNIGLLSVSPAPIRIEIAFYLADGTYLDTKTYDLLPFEFRQLDKAFESVTPLAVDNGYVVLRTTTGGARFLAYASVVDNITGDPIFEPVMTPQ